MIRVGCLLGWLVAWGGIAVAMAGEPVRPDQTQAERFAAIQAEYATQQEVMYKAVDAAKTEREQTDLFEKLTPDDVVYSRRMVNLALEQPSDLAARDALIWVVNKPGRLDVGAYGDEFARAGALLVRHHGDDPFAVSVGLQFDSAPTPRREALLFGFLVAARGREAKGIAQLALGSFLFKKLEMIDYAHDHPGWPSTPDAGEHGGDGPARDQNFPGKEELDAYLLGMPLCDPAATRAEVARLFHEVIDHHGDVPYITHHRRLQEAMLNGTKSAPVGVTLTADQRRQLTKILQQTKTLGEVATGYLDEMDHIAPGLPAPAIEGVDLNGQPLKLADYRGKVVVLVFWGSWCGPCLTAIPQERELAARYQDKPFALLGVDCRDTPEVGRKVVETQGITWPNFHDNDPDGDGDGPIVERYHVRGYPSSFVIDAQGIIRHKHLTGQALDDAVAKLLAEVETPAAGR